MLRRAATAAALVGLLLCGGCGSSGDRTAEHSLDQLQDSLLLEAQQHFRRGDDPAWLAIWAANDSGVREAQSCSPRTTVTVEPLSWGSPDGYLGQVDLHLHVATDGFQGCGFSQPGYGPGQADRCVRFTIGTADFDNEAQKIPCSGRTPVPAPASASERNWPGGQPPGG